MDNLEELMCNIRRGRQIRRSIPENLCNCEDSGDDSKKDEIEYKKGGSDRKENNPGKDIKEIDDVDKLLEKLKRCEPTSDSLFFRLSIITYEVGDLNKSIVYMERFKEDEKIRAGHSANGKLALADILTQLYLLCASLGWDFHELRKLGAKHLEERHEDFKCQGWNEIK